MMKLFIGNKAYSSWSLRGWLACKLSGLPFEEVVVPLYDQAWEQRREGDEFAPSSGKVPILWDGDDIVVWDSLAIIEYLNEKSGEAFWPADPAPLSGPLSEQIRTRVLSRRESSPRMRSKSFPNWRSISCNTEWYKPRLPSAHLSTGGQKGL